MDNRRPTPLNTNPASSAAPAPQPIAAVAPQVPVAAPQPIAAVAPQVPVAAPQPIPEAAPQADPELLDDAEFQRLFEDSCKYK